MTLISPLLIGLYILALAYGTLHPFNWRGDEVIDIGALVQVPAQLSFQDLLTNLLVYIPLGLLWIVARQKPGIAAGLGGLMVGVLISAILEILQLWLPGRITSVADLLMNTLGTLAGLAMGYCLVLISTQRNWILACTAILLAGVGYQWLSGNMAVPEQHFPGKTLTRETVIPPASAGNSQPMVIVDGVPFLSMKAAQMAIQDGSQIELLPGIYRQGLLIKQDHVLLKGQDGVIFDGAQVLGKATLVIAGNDVVIEDIECRNVQVRDRNGACVRQQGKNLLLRRVYFHDSQQGLLSAQNTGWLKIEDSRFERLGKAGRAHGIYAANDEIFISNSVIINARDQGHEVKSSARRTVIDSSYIGTIDGNDSRALDLPSGGELLISNSVIFQGAQTKNADLIGYGLEKKRQHQPRRILIENSLFIAERQQSNRYIHTRPDDGVDIQISGSIFVGDKLIKLPKGNRHFPSRRHAHLPPYPQLPSLENLGGITRLLNSNQSRH